MKTRTVTVGPGLEEANPHVAAYREAGGLLPRTDLAWLRARREEAFQSFQGLGFPTARSEEWKYTNVNPIGRGRFPLAPASGRVDAEAFEVLAFPRLGGPRVVFVDGWFAPQLSRTDGLPAPARVESLARLLEEEPKTIEAQLGSVARIGASPFTALNAAHVQDGAFVHVPDGTALAAPIHLVFLATQRDAPFAQHPRNLVVVGDGAQITLVESHLSVGAGPYFTNAITELSLGASAVVDHYKIQREGEDAFHVGGLHVRQARGSQFSSHVTSLGAALSRNEIHQTFEGEGADCALNGLYAVGGRQHVDVHTRIDHREPRCASRELYKGILDGESTGVFYGMILVRKGAQKTDASQTNKNLILSEKALVNSTPALEINADDVKCSHASATGQLDRDALFYLRSRGIDDASARSLLTYAFARELVQRVKPTPIRAQLNQLILSRLPNGGAVQEVLHEA